MGDLGPDWRRYAVVVGPVSFVGLKFAANRAPAKLPDAAVAVYKTLVVVALGRNATVTISAAAGEHASLLYDSHNFRSDNRYELSDGVPQVSFSGCPGREAQFSGSFLVKTPRCVPVQVKEPGRPTASAVVNFAASVC